jgi:hypothetical protein
MAILGLTDTAFDFGHILPPVCSFFLTCAESFAVQGLFKVFLSYPAFIGMSHSVTLT